MEMIDVKQLVKAIEQTLNGNTTDPKQKIGFVALVFAPAREGKRRSHLLSNLKEESAIRALKDAMKSLDK